LGENALGAYLCRANCSLSEIAVGIRTLRCNLFAAAGLPCNAVFEPGVGWIAENEGVPPDIEVRVDARSVAQGRDPQLERAVQEALRMLEEQGPRTITVPAFPRPAGWPPGGSSNP
jgi:hypothetical protein